jgi:thiol-disulfide isomerase/thioredoxin
MTHNKTFLLSVVAGVFSLTASAQVKFSAKIANKPTDTIYVKSRGFSQMIVADKKGNFNSTFKVTDGMFKLEVDEQYADLYLTNTSDIQVALDYKDFDNTIKFKGKGANENSFLAAESLKKQDESAFEPMMKAENIDALNIEVNKYKETIFAALPKDLDAVFVSKYKADVENGMKGMVQYLAGAFELKKLNGTTSPSFNFENHKGGLTSLESLKGKYVYIDVWATWCGPCRQEIPFLQKTEEAYHGKNIEFVSISIDVVANKEKWNKFVIDNKLGGIQLLADKDWKSDFVQGYKINGIPRFILISPEGKIINADAPRPSSPELVTLLDSLVK